MIGRLGGAADAGQHDLRSNPFPLAPLGAGAHPPRRRTMQWQTPTATDFRFGFEITMYVAAR